MTLPTHILWDWNGTLLDDTQAALDTLNEMLSNRGRPPIAMDFYRERFSFPVRPFYETIGISVPDSEWDALAREYHDVYLRQARELNREALAAVRAVRSAGARQSILSALRQDLLLRDAVRFGIAACMDNICGTNNLDGSSKLSRALELKARLTAAGGPLRIVMIGDSLHDLEVAKALSVECVLCATGTHTAARLRAAAPTAETLLEAVKLALSPRRDMV